MKTRILSERRFRATFGDSMRDISGSEDVESPDGVIDIRPYVLSIPPGQFGSAPLVALDEVTSVYRNAQGGFDHVLLACERDNLFLVVVVNYRKARIHGHYFLDLAKEYGLDAN